jgi:hypothetical protein
VGFSKAGRGFVTDLISGCKTWWFVSLKTHQLSISTGCSIFCEGDNGHVLTLSNRATKYTGNEHENFRKRWFFRTPASFLNTLPSLFIEVSFSPVLTKFFQLLLLLSPLREPGKHSKSHIMVKDKRHRPSVSSQIKMWLSGEGVALTPYQLA